MFGGGCRASSCTCQEAGVCGHDGRPHFWSDFAGVMSASCLSICPIRTSVFVRFATARAFPPAVVACDCDFPSSSIGVRFEELAPGVWDGART